MTRKVEVIAELANAHQGDPLLAYQLADEAIKANADAIKFQVYFADELLTRDHPRFEHFKKQSFSRSTWLQLLKHYTSQGVRVYCDIFGDTALKIALDSGVFGVKVHSSDMGNSNLLKRIPKDVGLLLSAGGTTAPELVHALQAVSAGERKIKPVLLHGYQTYPTPIADSNLARLHWLKEQFGSVAQVGYQDHVDGEHDFATTLPLMAIAMGAEVIEKHITLDRAAKGVDYYSSLNPPEFKELVEKVRLATQSIECMPESFSPSEHVYRQTVKKQWVAAADLPVGHILRCQDLQMKRVPVTDVEPVPLEKLLGRPLKSAVKAEQIITRDLVPAIIWACIVARYQSSRLPGKALKEVTPGVSALSHLFARVKQMNCVDNIVLCTSLEPEDDHLERVANSAGVSCYRGSVLDVLGRMLGAVGDEPVDLVLRITGDDILLDPDYADQSIHEHLQKNAQYTSSKLLPSGTELEVFDTDLLQLISKSAEDRTGTEYLTTYINENGDHFRKNQLNVLPHHRHDWRLTMDTPEDFEVICALLKHMQHMGRGTTYNLDDIVDFFDEYPEILEINGMVRQRSTPPEVNTRLIWSRCVGGK